MSALLCVRSRPRVTADNMRMHSSFSPSVALVSLVSLVSLVGACTPTAPESALGRRPVVAADATDDDGDIGPVVDDIDGDGALNNDDTDVDGDTVANNQDDDLDGDGADNDEDPDVDGDGIANADDDTPFGTATGQEGAQGDLDGDGISNAIDNDDDGDGLVDGVQGIGACDQVIAETENTDCDGHCTGIEGSYTQCDDGVPPGTGRPDRDGDGFPDGDDEDDDGNGIPDDQPIPEEPPPTCVENTFDVSANNVIPPRILLVVDKSGSMGEPATGFGARKWDAARTAINSVVGQATAQFGLMLYPNGDANNDVCEAGTLRVGVNNGTTSNITNTLANTEPGGGTPTAVTLVEAIDAMNSLPVAGGTRAVVLATDGGPNCNDTLNGDTCRCVSPDGCADFPLNCLDDTNATTAAAQVAAAGFPLFVIGIPGSENFVDVLNGMAAAGGTNQVFNAATPDALAQQIDSISQVLAGCRFTLQQNLVGATNVTVTVDGVVVTEDPTNGYTLVGDVLELRGTACADLQQGAQAGATVSAQLCDG